MNAQRFVSNGHAAGRFRVDIYANEAGSRGYRAARGDVPVGAILIKEHFESIGGQEQNGPIMMMEKREKGFDPEHGDWNYVVANAKGELLEKGGIPSCSGCHDQAPHDHIFALP